jgi:hypothetical protein
MIAAVISPPQEKNEVAKGVKNLLRTSAPPTEKKRYINMLFIPTIMKNFVPVKIFLTSISQ